VIYSIYIYRSNRLTPRVLTPVSPLCAQPLEPPSPPPALTPLPPLPRASPLVHTPAFSAPRLPTGKHHFLLRLTSPCHWLAPLPPLPRASATSSSTHPLTMVKFPYNSVWLHGLWGPRLKYRLEVRRWPLGYVTVLVACSFWG
jgi:hypothetical protein